MQKTARINKHKNTLFKQKVKLSKRKKVRLTRN